MVMYGNVEHVKTFLCSENSLRMFMSQAKNRAERSKFSQKM